MKDAYETINRTYTGLAVMSLVGFVFLLLTFLAKVQLDTLDRGKNGPVAFFFFFFYS